MQIRLSLCYLCMHLCTWMPINRCWYRARASVTCAARASSLPQFVPQDKAKEIRSPQAWDMLMSYQQCTVDVAGLPSLRTSFVGPRLHFPEHRHFCRRLVRVRICTHNPHTHQCVENMTFCGATSCAVAQILFVLS